MVKKCANLYNKSRVCLCGGGGGGGGGSGSLQGATGDLPPYGVAFLRLD